MIDETVEAIEFMKDVAEGKIQEAEVPENMENSMVEWTFSNDKENPAIRQLFHLLYNGVFKNKVGVMHALNKETDVVETLIVGIDVTDGNVAAWPIAKLLTEEEQGKYLSPDGNGSYV